MTNLGTESGLFYQSLPVFSDFAKVSDAAAFVPLPEDWTLLASDIVRSRDAIAAGRYKDVNMVAAAVVTAVLNVAGRMDLPFVFGGDGALIAVPPSLVDAASRALVSVRVMARETSALRLRVAAIPVAALRRAGADLRVAKFELSRGNNLAMFSGGGIELAETILKDEERVEPYRLVEPDLVEPAPLDGLSCRWEPLPARRGRMVTLLVRPTSGRVEELSGILEDLRGMLGIDLTGADPASAPVRRSSLRFRFPPAGLTLEARMVGWKRGRWRAYLVGLAACAAFVVGVATGRRLGPFEPERYLHQVALNTDFRKFDDTLRLVLDLDSREREALTGYLAREEASGRLAYGLHVSDEALMTCLVFSLEDNRHIHFIDGADGGYARAAQDFKQRLSAVKEPGATA
ncbi:DUF3095 domain-containing protein [Stappia sp. 28M-7]|uniref:DUF3095 domain-containing protein n=1 Tax=Stappia sp. 28M-7 TaxID=2762596 RepID=UPI00163CB2A6|nr:DUF3095 domain-containing protein [Stappia sp. 28M-7]MBC2858309.1 DUF3095 domain-containing protein [Stappia sp. 28M-7]